MKVALGGRLGSCPAVRSIGLKCNWHDYSASQQAAIMAASRIYFPTIYYAGAFHAAGKDIFPSFSSYYHLGDKIRQLALFSITKTPHPRTRIFFGSEGSRRGKILSCFSYPFVGKIPVGSGRGQGVFLIKNRDDLRQYVALASPSYIQEYIPAERDLRVVIIGGRIVNAYWKVSVPGNFRTNVAQGGRISFEDLPEEALEVALSAARKGGIDYAGFDLCMHRGRWLVLEANMNFGLEGFAAAGLDLGRMLCGMIARNQI